MVFDETLTLVMGIILGFAAVVVYELKFVMSIERKISKLLNKIESMEATEIRELLRLEKTPEKKARK